MRRLWVVVLLLISGLSVVAPALTAERPPETALSASPPLSIPTATPFPGGWDSAAQHYLPRSPESKARVQDLVGDSFPIADFPDAVTGADDLDLPSVAYNSRRGQYLVVWHGALRATGFNIYARGVSAVGVLSPTVVAVCEAPRDQLQPSIAFDAQADQYWAVWEDERSGAASQVYARRLSPTGMPSGDEILVNTSTNDATRARLVCGGSRCMIVWTEESSEALEVYARAYDAAGNALTLPVRISATGSRASTPDVAYDGSADRYLVVWSEQQSATGLDIRGQLLSKDLSPVGAPVGVCVALGDQDRVRLAYGARSNRYCVVWQDRRSGTSCDVYAQILSSTAGLQGASLPLYTGRENDGETAVAARDNEDQFLVSFGAEQCSFMESGYPYIRACTVTGVGAVSAAFDVRLGEANRRWSPAIAHRAGSDEYLVVWVDGYFWPGDIMAQRVRGNRTLLGSPFLVCATRKGQEAPAVAYNSQRDRYLVAWEDFRSGQDYDIYARLLSGAGHRYKRAAEWFARGRLQPAAG